VESGQRDELELVAELPELLLERGESFRVSFFAQLNDGEQLYASIFAGNFA